MEPERFKIWRNPTGDEAGPVYMGEFRPPDGHLCFDSSDLLALGFTAGSYTVRVPELLRELYVLPPWQRIEVQ
jgi:hypothetical protein